MTISYFKIFPTCPTQKRTRFKTPKHPVPGDSWKSRGSDCSKDQNYCSPGKSSQKNPEKSLPLNEWIAMLAPVFAVGGEARVRKKKHQHFPFHTLSRVVAIYGASPAFSTNRKTKCNCSWALHFAQITGNGINRASQWVVFFTYAAAIASVIAGRKKHKATAKLLHWQMQYSVHSSDQREMFAENPQKWVTSSTRVLEKGSAGRCN